jgi:hypothetical protein
MRLLEPILIFKALSVWPAIICRIKWHRLTVNVINQKIVKIALFKLREIYVKMRMTKTIQTPQYSVQHPLIKALTHHSSLGTPTRALLTLRRTSSFSKSPKPSSIWITATMKSHKTPKVFQKLKQLTHKYCLPTSMQ